MTKQEQELLRKLIADMRHRAKAAFDQDMESIDRFERLAFSENADTSLSLPALPVAIENENGEESEVTLIDSVAHVFKRFPEQSWNVNTIERQLLSERFVFAAKNPKASINTALSRLAERGIVRISKRGAGRKPNQYRAEIAVNAEANGHVEAMS